MVTNSANVQRALCLKALALFSRGNVSRVHSLFVWDFIGIQIIYQTQLYEILVPASFTNLSQYIPFPFSCWISIFKAFCLPLEDDSKSTVYDVYMNVAANMANTPHNAT